MPARPGAGRPLKNATCDAAQVPGATLRDVGEHPKLDESDLAHRLVAQGFVLVPQHFSSPDQAWAAALSVATHARELTGGGNDGLEVVGEFNVPPEGTEQRDFQALHVDFGFRQTWPAHRAGAPSTLHRA